jgi:hypothetical protein
MVCLVFHSLTKRKQKRNNLSLPMIGTSHVGSYNKKLDCPPIHPKSPGSVSGAHPTAPILDIALSLYGLGPRPYLQVKSGAKNKPKQIKSCHL